MLDLHHGSIETVGKMVAASLTVAAIQVREAQAIGGGGCGCEGEEVKYRTLGANPVVL